MEENPGRLDFESLPKETQKFIDAVLGNHDF